MSSDGKVKVIVRSRRVPARTVDICQRVYAPSGIPMGTETSRLIVYDYILDEEHRRAVEEGKRLSSSMGLDLEVVDASRRGVFGRAFSSFLSRSRGPQLLVTLARANPSVVPVQSVGPATR